MTYLQDEDMASPVIDKLFQCLTTLLSQVKHAVELSLTPCCMHSTFWHNQQTQCSNPKAPPPNCSSDHLNHQSTSQFPTGAHRLLTKWPIHYHHLPNWLRSQLNPHLCNPSPSPTSSTIAKSPLEANGPLSVKDGLQSRNNRETKSSQSTPTLAPWLPKLM